MANQLFGQMVLQRARRYHLVLRFGFARSRRVKTGGWKLAKAPSQITLLEIVEALEPESPIVMWLVSQTRCHEHLCGRPESKPRDSSKGDS